MNKILLQLAIGILFTLSLNAQQVVFTSKDNSDNDIFWSVNESVNPSFSYVNITSLLLPHYSNSALEGISNKGPISISHEGDYFIFQSTRFASASVLDGYEGITICKSDFSYFEVPVDSLGKAFHNEGIMQISNDGKTIYFTQGGGTHARDIFKITKGASYWSNPKELTTSITFTNNISPYLSYSENKLLFESNNDDQNSTVISEINTDGTGLSTIVLSSSIQNCVQVKSPCYDISGNIFFEGEANGEKIYKIASGSNTPLLMNSNYSNDNSPVTLPDGKIISLLETNTHQIKMMEANGTSYTMLSQSGENFTDILDIGISAGGGNLTSIEGIAPAQLAVFTISFDASNEFFTVNTQSAGLFLMINELGQTIDEFKLEENTNKTINVSALKNGLYIISGNIENKIYNKKFTLIK